jgi:hypothetical protein
MLLSPFYSDTAGFILPIYVDRPPDHERCAIKTRDHQRHTNLLKPAAVSWFLDYDLVYVTPKVLAPFNPELDDGVTGLVKVLGGMLPGRVVAAAHVTTNTAQA